MLLYPPPNPWWLMWVYRARSRLGKLSTPVWGQSDVQGGSEAESEVHISLYFPWTRNSLQDEINRMSFPWSGHELSVMMECSKFVLSNMVASSHMWPVSMTATEKQNFYSKYFNSNFNSYVWLVAEGLDHPSIWV